MITLSYVNGEITFQTLCIQEGIPSVMTVVQLVLWKFQNIW